VQDILESVVQTAAGWYVREELHAPVQVILNLEKAYRKDLTEHTALIKELIAMLVTEGMDPSVGLLSTDPQIVGGDSDAASDAPSTMKRTMKSSKSLQRMFESFLDDDEKTMKRTMKSSKSLQKMFESFISLQDGVDGQALPQSAPPNALSVGAVLLACLQHDPLSEFIPPSRLFGTPQRQASIFAQQRALCV
jgi:hypothetical protein